MGAVIIMTPALVCADLPRAPMRDGPDVQTRCRARALGFQWHMFRTGFGVERPHESGNRCNGTFIACSNWWPLPASRIRLRSGAGHCAVQAQHWERGFLPSKPSGDCSSIEFCLRRLSIRRGQLNDTFWPDRQCDAGCSGKRGAAGRPSAGFVATFHHSQEGQSP